MGHVLGLNAVYCLSDFTASEGTTLVLPRTHTRPETRLPTEDQLRPQTVAIQAKAGSVIVWDVNLWHGASAHDGRLPRRAVFSLWRRQWLRPQFDLAAVVIEA